MPAWCHENSPDRTHRLPVTRQCRLLDLSRSTAVSFDEGGIIVGRVIRSRHGVIIGVVNLSRNRVIINHLGLRIGFLKRTYFTLVLDPDPDSSPIPTTLEEGGVASYFISTDQFEKDMRHILNEWLIPRERRFAHRSMRLLVRTTTGRRFWAKPGPLLRQWTHRIVDETTVEFGPPHSENDDGPQSSH